MGTSFVRSLSVWLLSYDFRFSSVDYFLFSNSCQFTIDSIPFHSVAFYSIQPPLLSFLNWIMFNVCRCLCLSRCLYLFYFILQSIFYSHTHRHTYCICVELLRFFAEIKTDFNLIKKQKILICYAFAVLALCCAVCTVRKSNGSMPFSLFHKLHKWMNERLNEWMFFRQNRCCCCVVGGAFSLAICSFAIPTIAHSLSISICLSIRYASIFIYTLYACVEMFARKSVHTKWIK